MTAIDDKHAALGGSSGWMGAPDGQERPTPDGVGRVRRFRGGSIYWHPARGAFEVHGVIGARYRELGETASWLGCPTSDELAAADGEGRFSRFEYGILAWHPKWGVASCMGDPAWVATATGSSPRTIAVRFSTFNAYLMDKFKHKPAVKHRGFEIGLWLREHFDLVGLQEVWQAKDRRAVLWAWPDDAQEGEARLQDERYDDHRERWRAHRRRLDEAGAPRGVDWRRGPPRQGVGLASGLLVLSQTLPVVRHATHDFEARARVARGGEVLADKGVAFVELDVGSTPDGGRGGLELFVTHFVSKQNRQRHKVRRKHLAELIEFVGVHHRSHNFAIVCGDFNIRADTDHGEYLQQKMREAGFRDLWLETHPGEAGRTLVRDDPDDESRIDYVFVQRPTAEQVYDVAFTRPLLHQVRRSDDAHDVVKQPFLSDHRGLSSTLVLTPRVRSNSAGGAEAGSGDDASLRAPCAASWTRFGPASLRLDVFALRADGDVQQHWWDGRWHAATLDGPPSRVGDGTIRAPLTAASWGPNRYDVFTVGANGHLIQLWWSDRWRWSDHGAPPEEVGGGALTGPPTAASWGEGRLDVFGVGANGHIWQRWWNGRWHWADLGRPPHDVGGGAFRDGSLTAASWGPNRYDVFGVGIDGHVIQRWWNGRWHWADLGAPPSNVGEGEIQGSLTAASWGPNRLDVFGLGRNGHVIQRWWDGRWHWSDLGRPPVDVGQGQLRGPLGATSWGPNRYDVFGRGGHDGIVQLWWNGRWNWHQLT